MAKVDGTNWPGLGKVVEYSYRGDGKRHERNVHSGNPAAGEVTTYHYGQGFEVTNEEYSGTGFALEDKKVI